MDTNELSINDIKRAPVPQSPQRQKNTLTGGVLSKSPLRPTKNETNMFSLTLCDDTPTNTVRVICFDEDMYCKFEPSKTYNIQNFILKQAYGSPTTAELQVDSSTKVAESQLPISIHHATFSISQILRGQASGLRTFSLKAKVMAIEDLFTVGTFPNQRTKRDIQLGDETGQISMVLWRECATNFQFTVGDVLLLNDMAITHFNNQMLLTTTFEASFQKLDEQMNVPTTTKTPVKSNIIEKETTIRAIKQFTASYKCIACRAEISSSKNNSKRLTCPSCTTMFLRRNATLNNHCQVLLDDNKWYSVNTGVIQHLFKWAEPKLEPSDADLDCILDEKFLLRVDTKRKIIEHAVQVQQNNDSLDLLDELDAVLADTIEMEKEDVPCKKMKMQ